MESINQKELPKAKLANSDLLVSKVGLGCMGISAFYTGTNPITEEQAIELIGQALDQGLNFFDTAHVYGDNELVLAKAIKKYGREKFVIATKVPPFIIHADHTLTPVPGTVENIKKYCEDSLKRLEIDQIDLYYQHRVDASIPIEEQVKGFKELIEEGKIRYYGLSEVSSDTMKRAHKVHPLTAIQEEYSLFTRDIENNGVLQTAQELGISVVAYSPLGRGTLTQALQKPEDLGEQDDRHHLPRFEKENLVKNAEKVQKLTKIAEGLKITTSQLALAWLLQKDNIFPIPGTKREKYLTQNNQSTFVELSAEQIKEIEALFPAGSTLGDRYPDEYKPSCTVDTPQLKQE